MDEHWLVIHYNLKGPTFYRFRGTHTQAISWAYNRWGSATSKTPVWQVWQVTQLHDAVSSKDSEEN